MHYCTVSVWHEDDETRERDMYSPTHAWRQTFIGHSRNIYYWCLRTRDIDKRESMVCAVSYIHHFHLWCFIRVKRISASLWVCACLMNNALQLQSLSTQTRKWMYYSNKHTMTSVWWVELTQRHTYKLTGDSCTAFSSRAVAVADVLFRILLMILFPSFFLCLLNMHCTLLGRFIATWTLVMSARQCKLLLISFFTTWLVDVWGSDVFVMLREESKFSCTLGTHNRSKK